MTPTTRIAALAVATITLAGVVASPAMAYQTKRGSASCPTGSYPSLYSKISVLNGTRVTTHHYSGSGGARTHQQYGVTTFRSWYIPGYRSASWVATAGTTFTVGPSASCATNPV